MNKYIVRDWAGNPMEWGTFNDYDDAMEAIDLHVREALLSEGINVNKAYGLITEYPELEELLERIHADIHCEYTISELLS